MKLTFVYVDDPALSEDENARRREALTGTITEAAEKHSNGESFDRYEPSLAELGEMLRRERIGYLLCVLP